LLLRRSYVRPNALLMLWLLTGFSCQNSAAPRTSVLRERWYQPEAGYGLARPAYSDGIVFFGSGHGQIIARHASSGAVLWNKSVGPDDINGGNLLVRSGVLIAPVGNFTVGVDAYTGTELWRYFAPPDTIGYPANAPPGNVADSRIDADTNTVYIPAWGATISALDIKTGAIRWVWKPGLISGDTATSGMFRSGSMGVRVSGDTLYATVWHYVTRSGGQSEAWVVALNRSNGVEIWRFRLPFKGGGVLIEGSPVAYQNLVIVHTLSGATYAVDRFAPSVSWQFSTPAALYSTVAEAELLDDKVYVDGGDGHLYALRARDGTTIWSAPFPTQATRDLLVTQRRVILTNSRTLFVFDRTSGRLILQVAQPHTADPLFASAACFGDSGIFITVGDAAWAIEEP
jgi:outer membrane protein assembly factor BamB